MNKWIEKTKELWRDPVWSKVIAAGIIFVSGTLFTSLYAIFQIIYSKISFIDTLKSVRVFLASNIPLPLWTLIFLLIVYLTFTLKPIASFVIEIFNIINKPKPIKQKKELPTATENSTVLFSYRMAKAFPGLRDLVWFNEPSLAIQRLVLLLKEPLRFKEGSLERESDPIWWFRKHSASSIDSFEKLGCNKVLMNIEQLKIKRIAAYHSDSYYRDFVYVETYAEKQTGINNISKDVIKTLIENFGYGWEEYGLIKFLRFWKKPIRREYYYDGATIIRGKVVDLKNAEFRIRYITDYNFIIAAKGSPYNSIKFERESKRYFDGLLTGKVEFKEFFEFLQTLNKNER